MKSFFSMIWAWILDAYDSLAEFSKNMLQDFKESNRYFKQKTAVIGCYLLFALATVVVFVPPGELNEIDAEVRISKTEIVGGRYFLVANKSSESWRQMVLTVNETYQAQWPKLRPGKKKAYFFSRFNDNAGQAPSQSIEVRQLKIECQEGEFVRNYRREK